MTNMPKRVRTRAEWMKRTSRTGSRLTRTNPMRNYLLPIVILLVALCGIAHPQESHYRTHLENQFYANEYQLNAMVYPNYGWYAPWTPYRGPHAAPNALYWPRGYQRPYRARKRHSARYYAVSRRVSR